MRVITHMRLESLVGPQLEGVDGWAGMECSSNVARQHGFSRFIYLVPFNVDKTYADDIPDIFIQEAGDWNRKGVLHGKLPDTWGSMDPTATNRKIHEKYSDIPSQTGLTFSTNVLEEEVGDNWSGFSGYYVYYGSDNKTYVVTRGGSYQYWWWMGHRVRCDAPMWLEVSFNWIDKTYTVVSYQCKNTDPLDTMGVSQSEARDCFEASWYARFALGHKDEGYHLGTWRLMDRISISENVKPFQYKDLFNEWRRRAFRESALHPYEEEWLCQHAFMEACRDIGKASDNMFQNISSASEFLAGALMGSTIENLSKNLKESQKQFLNISDGQFRHVDKKFLASSTSNSWLQYRYELSTTNMDIKQFSNYIVRETERYFQFLDREHHEISHGTAHRVVDGVDVVCHCSIAWRPRAVLGLQRGLQLLHQYGLEVNPYVLWDSIPFSFVADWFLPIGDVAEVMSDKDWYTDDYYDFSWCCLSTEYIMPNDEGKRYHRWYQNPPLIEGYYWFDDQSKASSKTITKRVLDSGALVYGIISK